VVVDQSEGGDTELALSPYLNDDRVRYVRCPTRGVAAARNVGIAASVGALVAFTDDDCRVPPDWVERFVDVFSREPDVAVLCGRVRTPPGSEAIGYAATFEPVERVYAGRFPPPGRDWGVSANMVIRREALQTIGLFDELLGSGAPLRSAAETDLLVRAWRAGLKVVNVREVEVLHVGIRRHGTEARNLVLGYGIGMGAVFAKYARIGGHGARGLYLRWLVHLLARNVRSVLTLKRPTGIGLTIAFLGGSLASLRYRITRDPVLFKPR
jgi:GT2 family glycosyltransferase